MKKYTFFVLLLIFGFCSFGLVKAQNVTPLTINDTLLTSEEADSVFDKYQSLLPTTNHYVVAGANQKIIFVSMENPKEYYEFEPDSELVRFEDQELELNILERKEKNTIYLNNDEIKIILRIEHQPINFIFVFVRPVGYGHFWDGPQYAFVNPSETIYEFSFDDVKDIDGVKKVDLLVVGVDLSDMDFIPPFDPSTGRAYHWVKPLELQNVDEITVVIDVDDQLMTELETDADEIITETLPFDNIGVLDIIFMEKEFDGVDDLWGNAFIVHEYEGKNGDGTEFNPLNVIRHENFLSYSGTWFNDYLVAQDFQTSASRPNFVVVSTNYEYPYTKPDNVESQIRSFRYAFNEPFIESRRDYLRIRNYGVHIATYSKPEGIIEMPRIEAAYSSASAALSYSSTGSSFISSSSSAALSNSSTGSSFGSSLIFSTEGLYGNRGTFPKL